MACCALAVHVHWCAPMMIMDPTVATARLAMPPRCHHTEQPAGMCVPPPFHTQTTHGEGHSLAHSAGPLLAPTFAPRSPVLPNSWSSVFGKGLLSWSVPVGVGLGPHARRAPAVPLGLVCENDTMAGLTTRPGPGCPAAGLHHNQRCCAHTHPQPGTALPPPVRPSRRPPTNPASAQCRHACIASCAPRAAGPLDTAAAPGSLGPAHHLDSIDDPIAVLEPGGDLAALESEDADADDVEVLPPPPGAAEVLLLQQPAVEEDNPYTSQDAIGWVAGSGWVGRSAVKGLHDW